MYQEHQFATPAIVLQLILIVGSLSIIFKTFIISIQLYPEESGKCLVDAKNYKNRIQLLCANSDPMDTIVVQCQVIVFLPVHLKTVGITYRCILSEKC
jgi:hypothetical protein